MKRQGLIKNKAKVRRKMKNTLQLYSFLAIPILHVFLFNYIPMVGVIIAFKDYRYDKGIFGSEWVGLNNFKYFFMSGTMGRLLRNTIVSNVVFILTGMITSVGFAVLLYWLRSKKIIKTVQTLAMTPSFVSHVILGYVVYALLSPANGLANQLLVHLGYERVNWYSFPEAWPVILTICRNWSGFGMGSVFYYATLTGIDPALYEAARIDGASRWQEAKYIMIPGLRTVITLQLILSIGGLLGSDFGLFYNVTRNQGALYKYTDVLGTYIFRMTRVVGDMGVSSAVGLLLSVVGMVLVISANAIARKLDEQSAMF